MNILAQSTGVLPGGGMSIEEGDPWGECLPLHDSANHCCSAVWECHFCPWDPGKTAELSDCLVTPMCSMLLQSYLNVFAAIYTHLYLLFIWLIRYVKLVNARFILNLGCLSGHSLYKRNSPISVWGLEFRLQTKPTCTRETNRKRYSIVTMFNARLITWVVI